MLREPSPGVYQNQKEVSGFDQQLDFGGQEVKDVVNRQRQLYLVTRIYARHVTAREPYPNAIEVFNLIVTC